MMPIPVFLPLGLESRDLPVRVQQLESALAISLGLLHTLWERLESKLGPDFLGEELVRLTAAGGSNAKEHVHQLDALVQQGQKPKAARQFRELSGVSWDQAHDFIGRWSSYSFDQKVRCIQISQWVQTLSAESIDKDSQHERGAAS